MSAQNGPLFMLEKWKMYLDEKRSAGNLLTDLSKAFDYLIHDLLLAKVNAYGFDYKSIKLLHNYFTERLLFNIYLRDLFLFF